jgi:hypothetical protein
MMAIQPFTPKPITDIFTSDTSINRQVCKRTVPMKVLVLGLGRTGTACMFYFVSKALAATDFPESPQTDPVFTQPSEQH